MAGKRWTGALWQDLNATRKRWTGSAWVDVVTAKRWTGSAWVDVFPGGPPVDPNLPTLSWVGNSSASSYFACESNFDPVVVCPVNHTFTLPKQFNVSAGTTLSGLPVSGISYAFAGNIVTFSASVARGRPYEPEPVFRTPIIVATNAFGSTQLAFSWVLTYAYTVAGGEPP